MFQRVRSAYGGVHAADRLAVALLLAAMGWPMACAAGAGDPASCAGKEALDLARIHGRIQVVESFPDYKVKVVESFADLHVQVVESFPDKPGTWKMVDSFPDYRIQFVESFPDFTIRYVSSFPGVQ